MSASKKKLQRREAVDPEQLTEEQIKQAEYKKKARLYTIIGVVIVVLVAALLIWNSGIFQKSATAATIGDTELSVTEMEYYYYNNQTRAMYSQYGISDSQVYDSATGATYRDLYMDMALATAQEIQYLYEEALANGYTEADAKEDVDAQIEYAKAQAAASDGYNYRSFLKACYGRHMTPALYKDLVTRNVLASMYYNDVATEKNDSFTLSDLNAYYDENPDDVDTFTYSYLFFRAEEVKDTDEDGKKLTEDEIKALKETAMADAKAKAEAALADYNEDIEIEALITKTTPTLSGDHTTATGIDGISSIYRDELLELDVDEAAVVEYEGNGYYVVVYHGRKLNTELTAEIYNIFVPATTTGSAAPTDEAWAAAKIKADKLLAQWENGDKTQDSFSALATENGMANGGLSTGISSAATGSKELVDWLFGDESRAAGDTTIARFESASYGYGYYVTLFSQWGESVWELNVRNTLTSEYLTEWTGDLAETYAAALADGAKHVAN